MDTKKIVAELLALTSPLLTREEKEEMEQAPNLQMLKGAMEIVCLKAIEKKRREKAQELLRQLLGL